MDFVDMFSEVYTPTDPLGIYPPETDLTPEQEFISFLEADDNMENFGLSILENNHDLIDVMTPLFATPFSPDPCDNLDLIDTSFQQKHQQTTETETPEISPLKQLLLGKSRTSSTNNNIQQPEVDNHAPVGKAPSPRRQSSRTSKSSSSTNTRTSRRSSSSTNNTKTNRVSTSSIYLDGPEIEQKEKGKSKEKMTSKALKFPPCYICGGLASGLHYGVNSCEACKGFFRRYIIRNEEYKCSKGGNCTVVNKNRENCSGCRLKKCLELGMSKENCKLGRYSLSRRTETIKKVNVLEGKEKQTQNASEVNSDSYKFDHTYSGPESGKYLLNLHDIVPEECSPGSVIEELVRAMDNIKPYGPNITNKKQIQKLISYHHDRYQAKVQAYGPMKAVSKDEYYKLFKEYGIDVDGRIKVFKEYITKLERLSERYYNFASQIPGFSKLESSDQTKLLNAYRCDFFIILMHECYDKKLGVLLARNGVAYHIDELSDKCFSGTMIRLVVESYFRLQRLQLSKEETSLLMALSLTFTDRCKLNDTKYIDQMQYIVSEVLRYYLERMFGSKAQMRLSKFIECLVYIREASEMYIIELKQLCKDEIMVREIPMLTEMISDDGE
ncbi:hypothetical protein ACF0H5_017799 [Mactra antiquata]